MIQNLQALRALAALMVVLFHAVATARGYGQGPSLWAGSFDLGQAGVDLFFVISGFVMMHTQKRAPRGAWDFLDRRLIRIVPLYWAFMALTLGLLTFFPALFGGTFTAEPDHVLASFLFSSLMLMGENPMIYLGWTLEWEFTFYCLFALGILFGGRINPALFAGLGLLALIPLGPANVIGLEFIYGMALAVLYHRGIGKNWAWPALAAGLLLLAASVFWPPVPASRAFVWGLPAALIVFGAVNVQQTKSRLLGALGDASYSIYLIQFLSLPAFYKLAHVALPNAQSDLLLLACLVTTALAGWLSYRLFERPVTRWLTRRLPTPTARAQGQRPLLAARGQPRTNS